MCCDVFLPALLALFFSCSAAHVARLSGHVVHLRDRACMNNDIPAGVIHLMYREFFLALLLLGACFKFQELEKELRRFEEHNSSNNTASELDS
jgi:hypothetical protein